MRTMKSLLTGKRAIYYWVQEEKKGALRPSKYLYVIFTTAPIKSVERMSSSIPRITKQTKIKK